MCGLAGFLSSTDSSTAQCRAIAQNMAQSLRHRGPDDTGVWCDAPRGIALAHRRLAIVDLSAAGHQPMQSASQRYVLAFNGEIYNHLALRAELAKTQKIHWRGHSDTETLLAAIEAWGFVATLAKLTGMFAVAVWDRQERTLSLARDRLGEKPLYYGLQGKQLLFGSELKALQAHPAFTGVINRDVLCLYLRHCCIPAPYSIYENVYKLPAAHYIQFLADAATWHAVQARPYWQLSEVIANSQALPFQGNAKTALAALESQLRSSIGEQMMADVPLGAFLSGGLDSSTIVALMQSQSATPIKTFTIGFAQNQYNEAPYGKAVAAHLGTEHHELYVDSRSALALVGQLGHIYDEPFADSSQIATCLVAQMAKQHVSVALSGDGGDELFCGYNRYRLAAHWHYVAQIPYPLRRQAGKLIAAVPALVWDRLHQHTPLPLPAHFANKMSKLASRLQQVNSAEALYYSLVSECQKPTDLVLRAHEPSSWLTQTGLPCAALTSIEKMMYLDAMTYLPDDILVKVDRAAMHNSLETRVPFLNHHLIAFAWSLPRHFKYQQGQTKWIIRQLLAQYIPEKLINRPKMGFAVPLDSWLRGELKDWAEDLLNTHKLEQQGFFNPRAVRQLWQEHQTGQHNWQVLLWTILMFQLWLETNH